uniref:Nuclear pore complex protein Nup98-Nup96 n=2 Tax=Clastoptera arizonana TaxID=38151 RepID=A0A1B6CZW3_9HEMI
MFQGSGFGSPSTSTPFGSFGTPATTNFQTPVFGGTNTSLFGQSSQPSGGGLFGSTTPAPAFGQTQTTQPSFGGFTSNTGSTGLFGSQQNATTTGTGLFGSSGTSAFGQTKPTFGAFSSSTSGGGLFGQQPQTQSPSIFGQTASTGTTNLFGSSTGFGSTIGVSGTTGTTVKFSPVTGTDTMIKNGVSQPISTRHHCITCMKEYETKSLEELRLEDYSANRKGPQQGAATAGSLFPQPLFGGGASTSTTTGGLFGQTENKPLFGGTNTSLGFGGTSSVFGNTSGGLFGKPAATQASAFGTPATTTNTFAFNTPTNANPFGANTNTVKPFGAIAPQTNLFGSTATQPTTGFGTTQNTGFGTFGSQPTQSMGLFQQNKSPFGVGTSTNNAFSFGQTTNTTTQATPSLFGAKPATTGFGSTFGSTTTGTTSTFGATGFGTTQNTGSVFGNTFKPPTSAFSFGQTPTTSSTLGTGLNLGGGNLFGANNANKPGGLFGSTTGGGLFGTSTFGNTSNTGFGATNTTGLGSSFSLGNNTMMGSNTFSNPLGPQNPQNTFSQQIIETLTAMPFGDAPIFKKLLDTTGKTDELLNPTSAVAQKALLNKQNYKISPQLTNKLKVQPIGMNLFTKKSLFDGLDEYDKKQTIQASPKRLDLKLPQKNLILGGNTNATLDKIVNDQNAKNNKRNDENKSPKDKDKSGGNNNEKSTNNSKEKVPRRARLFEKVRNPSPKEKAVDDLVDSTKDNNKTLNSSIISDNITINETSINMSTFLGTPEGPENTMAELVSKVVQQSSENKENIDHSSSSTSSEFETSEFIQNPNPHPAGIILNRVGYYTIPPLEELAKLVDSNGQCIVENFTIGRHNYGNIFYPVRFDVAGLNLDEIVHIRSKEVVVYPDDENKPPVGEGLNRPAQVTLDGVWPADKHSRQLISDPNRLEELNYENTLRRASIKNNTRFKEYRPQTGSWVFKVDHFSKYGLSDSDEDENASALSEAKKPKMSDAVPPVGFPLSPKAVTELVLDDEDEDMEDGLIKTPFDLDENYQPKHQSPTMQFAKEIGASSNKVQLMKASFFQDDDEDDDINFNGEFLDMRNGDILDFEPMNQSKKLNKSFHLLRTQFSSNFKSPSALQVEVQNESTQVNNIHSTTMVPKIIATHSTTGPEVPPPLPDVRPQSVHLRCPVDGIIPYEKSVISRINMNRQFSRCCIADCALMFGRGFRPGWGKDYNLLSLTTKETMLLSQEKMETILSPYLDDVGEKLMGRNGSDMTPSVVQHIQVLRSTSDSSAIDFQGSIESHLEIALEHSIQDIDDNGCPVFAPKPGNEALHAHSMNAQNLVLVDTDPVLVTSYEVWDLCVALWGNLPFLPTHVSVKSHHSVMERRQAVSEWLENVVSKTVSDDLVPEVCAANVFTLLTGHCILKACEQAQELGDHFLSLLTSQIGGNNSVRGLVDEQLQQWTETHADQNIDLNRMKLMMLVAGRMDLEASYKVINVCEDLDWRRAFAIHLWYVSSSVASVTDALLNYESAFTENEAMFVKSPHPEYYTNANMEWEATSGKPVYDICYHLLKLYSNRTHSLEPLLNPAAYSPDSLDYRLSWLMLLMLESLGYSHLSEYSVAHVHTSFAAQLESHGLWHWAIFVLLHIQNADKRKSAVLDVLGRHISLSEFEEKEKFLIEKLKIPEQWIYQAKTTLALSFGEHKLAAVLLTKAKRWNESHSVIMEHIIAQAVIDEKYDYIASLLQPFTIEGRSKEISGWNNQGSLIWDYLNIVQQVNFIVSKRDPAVGYELEKLQPQLSSICARINLMPTPTAKHRLAQVEIAKRVVHLVRTLLFLQKKW